MHSGLPLARDFAAAMTETETSLNTTLVWLLGDLRPA
jgi:hypothetical protein